MKLYRYTCGMTDTLGPAEDEQDAYERRTEVDPTFHYLPVVVEEVKVEGYEINVTPVQVSNVPIEDMDKGQLKQYLRAKNIQFTPQWGEDKLREVALQHGS